MKFNISCFVIILNTIKRIICAIPDKYSIQNRSVLDKRIGHRTQEITERSVIFPKKVKSLICMKNCFCFLSKMTDKIQEITADNVVAMTTQYIPTILNKNRFVMMLNISAKLLIFSGVFVSFCA